MDCPWRRTLASVFLLLSPHSVRVLSQNVVPAGPLPLLPFMRDITDIPPFGPSPQQMNFMQQLSGIPEFVPQVPFTPPLQGQEQFRFGPTPRNEPSNFLSPTVPNVGSIPQVPVCNAIEPLVNGPLAEPVCYPTPNNILAQPGPVLPSPFSFPPPLISLPVPAVVPIPLQNVNAPPISNLPPQASFNIPPVPLNPGPQCPLNSGPQALTGLFGVGQPVLPQNTGALLNPQMYPLPFSQQCPATALTPQLPCSTADIIPAPLLPLPNLPPAIPVQNCVPFTPPYQPVLPPQLVPMEYIPITPTSPVNLPTTDFQIAALPPVLPILNLPPYYDYNCMAPRAEEHTPVPINLEINMPSPIMPEPKITVITAFTPPASPPPPVITTDSCNVSDVSFGLFSPPPLPPIIIESRRSKSRSWLPLILIALFARNGCDCGCGGCCPCNSANTDIPIPFPIPIPTSNPIILNSGCPPRYRGSRVKVEKKES